MTRHPRGRIGGGISIHGRAGRGAAAGAGARREPA